MADKALQSALMPTADGRAGRQVAVTWTRAGDQRVQVSQVGELREDKREPDS